MYAIFRAAGKQFRAEKGKTLRLPLMDAEAGSKVTFDEVLLSSDGETIKAGAPLVKGAKVDRRSGRRGQGSPRSTYSSSSGGRTIAARPDIGRATPRSASPTSSWAEAAHGTQERRRLQPERPDQQSPVSRRQALRRARRSSPATSSCASGAPSSTPAGMFGAPTTTRCSPWSTAW